MDTYQSLNPRVKARQKFYDRIRLHLEDPDLSPKDNLARAQLPKLPKQERLQDTFGLVTKEEFSNVLKSYNEQQSISDLHNKPTKCDQVTGGSFAKLLFSKPGFHNPGSNAYLVDDLKLRDIDRGSFLGYHSTMAVGPSENLEAILKRQQKMHIAAISKKVFDALDENNVNQSIMYLREIDSLNRDDCNAFAARGRHASFCKEYDVAITELRKALKLNCSYPELTKKHLSQALCAKACELYHKQDYATAKSFFTESIINDEGNQQASFHLRICEEKLIIKPFGADTRFFKCRK